MIEFKHLQKVMEEYAMYLLNATKSNLPDTYRIKSALSFTFEIDGNFYNIIFKAPDYFYYVENGRKPGKCPPISAIEKWIEVKKITPYPTAKGKLPSKKQLAFLISRSIGRDGTKATPTFALSRALDTDKSYWEDKIDQAVMEDVSENVENIMKLHR